MNQINSARRDSRGETPLCTETAATCVDASASVAAVALDPRAANGSKSTTTTTTTTLCLLSSSVHDITERSGSALILFIPRLGQAAAAAAAAFSSFSARKVAYLFAAPVDRAASKVSQRLLAARLIARALYVSRRAAARRPKARQRRRRRRCRAIARKLSHTKTQRRSCRITGGSLHHAGARQPSLE